MKKLHPRCAALWQAPASWERKNYSIVCKSIHQNYPAFRKHNTKEPFLTTLNYGKHISWGFPNLLFLEVLNLSEESNCLSFCGLFEIHYPLSSPMISFSPSSSLPFHSTPVSCQIWMILKGNISHQDWSHMVSTKMTGEVSAPRKYSTGMMWETQFLLLHSHPWNELSLLDPRISTSWLQLSF